MKTIYTALSVFILYACNAQTKTGTVNAEEFEKGIAKENVQVLDVRTAGEYNSGHITNALLADWNNKEQFTERIKYVDKTIPVYVYCLSGGRSAAAADWMKKNGFTSVVNLEGGINAWKKSNKPLEGVSNEKQYTLEEYKTMIPADSVVLVDFGAKWCPPCVKMEPVLQQLITEKGTAFKFVRIDGGVHTDVMKAMNVEALPVFIIYKNGKEVWRKQGLTEKKEFLQHL
jgi:rhodanese-related sulfurtransferase